MCPKIRFDGYFRIFLKTKQGLCESTPNYHFAMQPVVVLEVYHTATASRVHSYSSEEAVQTDPGKKPAAHLHLHPQLFHGYRHDSQSTVPRAKSKFQPHLHPHFLRCQGITR